MRATPLSPGALLHRDRWRALGVSTARLRGPELVAVFPGYFTPADAPATLNEVCRTLQGDVLPGSVISHGTAAVLMGIPVPWWLDNGIGALAGDVTPEEPEDGGPLTIPLLPRPTSSAGNTSLLRARRSNGPGKGRATPPVLEDSKMPRIHATLMDGTLRIAGPHVQVHRSPHRWTWDRGGIRMSHPYLALMELATVLEHDDLVIAIDGLVSTDPPLRGASLEAIGTLVRGHDRAWGARAMRAALADARPRSGSPGETRTRLLLRRAGFPEPELNTAVDDPDTGGLRYLDLAYPDLRIAIEYDGEYHRRDPRQQREDQARDDSLASAGWDVRHLNAADISAPGRFLTALSRSFARAGATGPSPRRWAGSTEQKLARSHRAPRCPERRAGRRCTNPCPHLS